MIRSKFEINSYLNLSLSLIKPLTFIQSTIKVHQNSEGAPLTAASIKALCFRQGRLRLTGEGQVGT